VWVRLQWAGGAGGDGGGDGGVKDVVMGEGEVDDDVDEIAEAAPPAAPAVVEKKLVAVARKTVPAAPTRRTRSSRLQAPTPVKKMVAGAEVAAPAAVPAPAAPAASAPRAKRALPKLAPAPTPSPPVASSTPAPSGMATRRTRIAKLGMSVNGTPAPKRRGRPVA
jgi:hypothetical protein